MIGFFVSGGGLTEPEPGAAGAISGVRSAVLTVLPIAAASTGARAASPPVAAGWAAAGASPASASPAASIHPLNVLLIRSVTLPLQCEARAPPAQTTWTWWPIRMGSARLKHACWFNLPWSADRPLQGRVVNRIFAARGKGFW